MTVLVAIHDVAPATLERAADLRLRARAWGVERATLLVVPDHHGRGPLERSPSAVAFLRQRAAAGDEIALHGHRHLEARPAPRPLDRVRARAGSAGEAECLTQSAEEVDAMLVGARRGLEAALGVAIAGFVAPAWLEPRGLAAALTAADFAWHESAFWIEDLRGRRPRRVHAPAIGLATRTCARRIASAAWLRTAGRLMAIRVERGRSPLRIALHPADLDCPPLVAALGDLVRSAATRSPCETVSAYLDRERVGE